MDITSISNDNMTDSGVISVGPSAPRQDLVSSDGFVRPKKNKLTALEKYTSSATSVCLNDEVDDENSSSSEDRYPTNHLQTEEDPKQEITTNELAEEGGEKEFDEDGPSSGTTDTATTAVVTTKEQQQQYRTPLQRRLHELQMKMNQSRQLNRKEVLHEGEQQQLQQGSKDGRGKHHYSASTASKKSKNTLMEPAYESLRRASQKQRRAEQNQFAVNDYYNPEGQFRNYERNLKTLPKLKSNNIDESTYDPLLLGNNDNNNNNSAIGEGARRLAEEMHRRIEKKKETKRKVKDIIEGDVNYINDRNKQFNKKIARNFDKYTAEIRHNLERGTAS
jgi:pre-mRNA-splicing factor SYF2